MLPSLCSSRSIRKRSASTYSPPVSRYVAPEGPPLECQFDLEVMDDLRTPVGFLTWAIPDAHLSAVPLAPRRPPAKGWKTRKGTVFEPRQVSR